MFLRLQGGRLVPRRRVLWHDGIVHFFFPLSIRYLSLFASWGVGLGQIVLKSS
jgi:hypothetical protein